MAITAYGRPLEPLDLPEPPLPPAHALLGVVTCGVCHSDVKTADGRMPFSAQLALPHVPGHEICARVLATEPDGALAPGTLVVVHHYVPCGRCPACRAGEENLCWSLRAWIGFTDPGGLEERLIAPLDRLFELPAGLDPIRAVPVTCAIGTAYRAVVTRGGVTAGTRVAAIGLGGVGIHVVQVARACAARVVGIDRSEAAVAAARELGIDARPADDVDAGALRQALDGPADVVVDDVGSAETLALATELLRPGGRLVGVGYAPGARLVVETPRWVLDELELVGSRYVARDELARAIDLVAGGAVTPVVGEVCELADANVAFDLLRDGAAVGRTVVRIGE